MKILDQRGKLVQQSNARYKDGGQPNRITIHHSAGNTGSADTFAHYHTQHLGWPGIGYHYVINRNGDIERCWNDTVVSYHTKGSNTGNIGICLVGNGSFTTEQMKQLITLIQSLQKRWGIQTSNVKGHREWKGQQTECPGFEVSRVRGLLPVRKLLRKGSKGEEVLELQNRLLSRGIPLPVFGADGIYGSETEKAVREYQKQYNLTADGVTGAETWGSLLRTEYLTT
ncbi:peptidoglycan recognition protein family protein [Alkalicoccus daliensis]|uniref:N-acetylmuramoyl-L-alanine amidase n=1 Tax=Alkalicoccus daliensis TaxID=745820 RepID=A0A1H0I738_9BACI|nr:N-acetylmuramoyl-L-alanine amidase [Alkalicoccus daliensis]SDO27175.1 N-acetyl-anhydromuramyl-L-alanine amidase AmpD [Alkalicoccus daliensis]